MWMRPLFGPFIVVVFAGTWQVPANGQSIKFDKKNDPGPSHIPVPFRAGANAQFADFLKSRDHAREAAESYKQVQELLKTLKPEDKDKLSKQLSEKLFDENGKLNFEANLNKEENRQLRRQLMDILENSYKKDGGGGGPTQQMKESVRRFTESGAEYRPQELPYVPDKTDATSSSSGPQAQQVHEVDAPPDVPLEEKKQKLQEISSSWWDKLKDGPLGNSESLRQLGHRLSQPLGGGESMETTEGFVDRLQRLGNSLPFKDFFSRLPRSSRSEWSSRPQVSAPSVGNLEMPNRGTLRLILFIGLGIIACALVWKLLTERRAALAASGLSAWRLGPWPVDPAQVSTREELIRAFEYLSLLRFGRAARSWNHRAIEKRLSAQSQEAAQHLAILYERARYAPPADPLAEDEVREARRDLCLLAGVAHA
jgi:hypothetical protein